MTFRSLSILLLLAALPACTHQAGDKSTPVPTSKPDSVPTSTLHLPFMFGERARKACRDLGIHDEPVRVWHRPMGIDRLEVEF